MVGGARPNTLAEALVLRRDTALTPYAGGTDLMVKPDPAAAYLFIGHLPELHGMAYDGKTLSIGAACTFAEALRDPATPPVLKEALAGIAAPAVRNLGTCGGNIANASPKGDAALIFAALDAKVRLECADGARTLPIMAFYAGRNRTALRDDELLTRIEMDVHGDELYAYQKVGARAALAISRLSFVGVLRMDGDRIASLATAYGAVADTIVRKPEIDTMLVGKTLREAGALRDAYLAAWDAAITPIRGRVSATYRKTAIRNLLNDFLDRYGIRPA